METIMALFSARGAANLDAKTVFAATFLKIAALACAFLTLLLAAIVLSWQARAWILTGEQSAFPISRALALAGFDEPSAVHAATGIQRIFDWALDLPASGFLLAVSAVLIGFTVFAATIEEQRG
jgi:hypothetical protein